MTSRQVGVFLLLGAALLPSCGPGPDSNASPTAIQATSPPTESPISPGQLDHIADVLRDYPLQVGASWEYSVDVTYAERTADDGTLLLSTWTGSVTETIVASRQTSDGLVFEGLREVEPPPPPGVWLEATRREYLVSRDAVTVDGLMVYRWPLEEGSAWPAFPGNVPELDYHYQVGAPGVADTPFGLIEDCYPLSLRTLPDASYEWFCPGVGPALRDYFHSGEPQEQHWRLVSFEPG